MLSIGAAVKMGKESQNKNLKKSMMKKGNIRGKEEV